jgi:hypothetical protein
MTSPELRATKPSAAIRITLAAAKESSFKRLRIDALADENLRASARDARTVRTVPARCEKLPKRLRKRGRAPRDTVLALSQALAERLDDLTVVLAVLLQVGEVVVEGGVDDAVHCLHGGTELVRVVHVAVKDLRPGRMRVSAPLSERLSPTT